MIHCGLRYTSPPLSQCDRKKKKGAASNYNGGHICSQCSLWLMCEGCGRSANQLQMAPIETSLIDWAWQTVTSTACSALLLMKWVMNRANTRRDLTLFSAHTHTLVRSALIWCHCLFFHLSAEEVVQTPQIVCLMAAALHINSIHCLCELQLPLTLIKYWCACKHSCRIEYFIQSHSLPPQLEWAAAARPEK